MELSPFFCQISTHCVGTGGREGGGVGTRKLYGQPTRKTEKKPLSTETEECSAAPRMGLLLQEERLARRAAHQRPRAGISFTKEGNHERQ